jgi:hypothetical protein
VCTAGADRQQGHQQQQVRMQATCASNNMRACNSGYVQAIAGMPAIPPSPPPPPLEERTPTLAGKRES